MHNITDSSQHETAQQGIKENSHISSEFFLSDNRTLLADINSMKFPKPRVREHNDFKSQYNPNILKDLQMMSQIADNYESCSTTFKNYMHNLLDKQIVKKQARTKCKNESALKKIAIQSKQLSSDNIAETINANFLSFQPGTLRLISIQIRNLHLYALVDSGASSTILNKNIADKLKLSFEPIHVVMTTATGSSENNCSGITQIQFKTLSNENSTVYFNTQAIICDKTNNFDLILGTNILFENNSSSISSQFWTITQKGEEIQIPL